MTTENQIPDSSELEDAKPSRKKEEVKNSYIDGMYFNWFIDYASYVILERAVPNLDDGLKPVHRRILHAMKRLDDGRFNKVANIIGYTMQYHPHGDASIGDALVQLGQKDILVETQGNWGNIYTGDSAAAPRYIEARLSKFALEVVFSPKVTDWKSSYDGRNKEPISLPVKFPLLLAQGVEGIAVGLASKILPHNFNELIDASIDYLENRPFEIYPDFATGGMADVSKYNDGLRGGKVRVRAKISKLDKKSLVITEIPFGTTTSSLIDSILAANDKGKIKIRKIDDNTAANVEVVVHLLPGVSQDKMIDALYAFTDCEISLSPNSCVIINDKPCFMGVADLLRYSAHHTKDLLRKELEVKKQELEDSWHLSSLEKIFIENRIYNLIEDCETWEAIIQTIDRALDPFKPLLRRIVTEEDIARLTEIKIKRISRFDAFKADEYIKGLEEEMLKVDYNLAHMVEFTVDYYKHIKKKYGDGRGRKTELRSFDSIEAAQVAEANEKLYINRDEGFVGMGLKKDEFVCDCSDIDDIIVFLKDGKYVIIKVSEKAFIGKNILYANVFRKNDERTIYNVVYQDGASGIYYMKRFSVTGITRDKVYDVTLGTPKSKILYFSANPNGEAETLKITLKPRPRIKILNFEIDFGTLAIKNRGAMGNLLTKNPIHRIVMKDKGISTLGGQNVWYDEDVKRLNVDGRGKLLGEFVGADKIAVMTQNGLCFTTTFELTNHYDFDIALIEKYDPNKVYAVTLWDAEQGFHYLKRFCLPDTERQQNYLGENEESRLGMILVDTYPRIQIKFAGRDANRPEEIVDVNEFIGVKSHNARGKRLTTFQVETIERLEPLISEEQVAEMKRSAVQAPSEEGKLFDTYSDSAVIDPSRDDSHAEQASLF